MKLVDPTDQELDAAFAEYVAGFHSIRHGYGYPNKEATGVIKIPALTRSADAVLPWLGADYMVNADRKGFVGIQYMGAKDRTHYAQAGTFAKAAVLVLLRAHGIEVEYTK